MENKSVSMTELPLQQLQMVKQEIEQDLNVLTASYGQLRQALGKFQDGQASLKHMVPANENKRLLAPLTESLYVPGLLANIDRVIVDVGTGYLAEMSVKDAMAFYSRKMGFVKESMDKLEITINQKQDQRGALVEVIQTKLMAIQAESNAAREQSAAARALEAGA